MQMDSAILERYNFVLLQDNVKPHQNVDKIYGVVGVMKEVRHYVRDGQVS